MTTNKTFMSDELKMYMDMNKVYSYKNSTKILFRLKIFSNWLHSYEILTKQKHKLINGEYRIIINNGLSWSWSYDSWIYNYLCNPYISQLTLWVRIPLMGKVYSIQHYIGDLRKIGGFLRFPPPIKLTATI